MTDLVDDELENRLSEKMGGSAEEKIKAKIAEFGGLLTRAAAVRLLCRQNGIEIDTPMPLAKAKGTSLPFSFRAKVDRIFPMQEHAGGSTRTVRLHVSDGSADATLVLWNEQTSIVGAGGIGAGDEIEVKGAYVRSGEICVSRGSAISRIGGMVVAPLAKLTEGECIVEGEVGGIEPDCAGQDMKPDVGKPFLSFQLCDGEMCRRVAVWSPEKKARPDAGDRLRLEGVVFKKGEIHFNSHSRLVRISSKARLLGKLERASVSSGTAFFVIDGQEYSLPCNEALRLLGVKSVPPGVEPSTLFSIKLQGFLGKQISYGKISGRLEWLETG